MVRVLLQEFPAEIDLVIDLPGARRWAVEVKRGSAPRVDRGLRNALQDIDAERAFIVYSGRERYPVSGGIEVLGVREMMTLLSAQAG